MPVCMPAFPAGIGAGIGAGCGIGSFTRVEAPDVISVGLPCVLVHSVKSPLCARMVASPSWFVSTLFRIAYTFSTGALIYAAEMTDSNFIKH